MSSTNSPDKNDSPAPDSPSRLASDTGGADQGKPESYPEQRHAGAVGYGPDYQKGATMGDKIDGYEEELKGKILRKPDLVQHGREMRTGELKKKAREGDIDSLDQGKNGHSNKSDSQGNSQPNKSDSQKAQSRKQRRQQKHTDTDGDVPKSGMNQTSAHPPSAADPSHPTEKGRHQEAPTLSPEGSADAEVQKSGEQS
ncbi:hypothetical protein CERSUDRAFT_95623 [Gelatoporia subvermispora B]|uniref:Uncharacterized protein n=1 Tax=Ceriporiopsis subvermispora (strain B) TaxID=914234 RepID=M2QGV9_CERS8|nr:hypothetical protein CERSUDRAFT_95623 [Gelatoporia subvermispora B]